MPTLWEEIEEEAKNTKECSDCKGKGKIQLFSSWEDPCKTCEGRGFVSTTTREDADSSHLTGR